MGELNSESLQRATTAVATAVAAAAVVASRIFAVVMVVDAAVKEHRIRKRGDSGSLLRSWLSWVWI